MAEYNFRKIEAKWKEHWKTNRTFAPDESRTRPKYYCLVMFPYPSGDLHVGHGRNYILGDSLMRWKFKEGYDVMFPIGWDAFGLPAENCAVEHDTNPRAWTELNIERMREQLDGWSISFDWSREVKTCDPDYYEWTQLLFLWMYREGLAYKMHASVNWCPKCATVLANEQVVGGACERCETPVSTRRLEQWFFKITDYAEELLSGLDDLTGWPVRVKTMQRNWIGKSRGVDIFFRLEDGRRLPCFTTRQDTIFGATYAVLSADHPEIESILAGSPRKQEALVFAEQARAKAATRRPDDTEKEGVFTGKYLVNPMNNERIPLWIADYVVGEYGTGVIMAVPAHDQRDFEFATKYGLPIRLVISPDGERKDAAGLEAAYEDRGTQVNSGAFNGLPSTDAMDKIADYMEERKIGKRVIRYRLRDWLISRQRYWGTPIPIVYCDKCGTVPVPENELPVVLPPLEEFRPTGESPLTRVKEFVETRCPTCAGPARRETDTMDTFVDSSWYYLRYLTPHDDAKPFGKEEAFYWLPVEMYIGGIEHAVMHLLYSRFVAKVLADMELIPVREPFIDVFTQGMVCKNGAKMSKSKGNAVPADQLIEKFGTDTVRLYTLFVGPPEKDVEWIDRGVEGCLRFINRLWRIADKISCFEVGEELPDKSRLSQHDLTLLRKTHWAIKKVRGDIDLRFHFNTAISAVMELVNEMYRHLPDDETRLSRTAMQVLRFAAASAVQMLAPMIPHVCEELWQALGHRRSIFSVPFPDWDEAILETETITVVVQVNGRVRASIDVPRGSAKEDIETTAEQDPAVSKWLAGKTVRKSIYIEDKLINFVVS
jgi:leucyl-tRNA synthetase